jgi:hypothetical protein
MTSRQTWHACRGVLRVLFWGGLVVTHVPALVASWSMCLHDGLNAAHLSGALGLSAAMVFFGLKLWNVECLRFDTSARSLVLITAAVVLLHGNAIQRRLDWAVVPQETPIAATTLLSLGLKRVRCLVVAAVLRSLRGFSRASLALSPSAGAASRTCVPPGWILAARQCTPRAPPV